MRRRVNGEAISETDWGSFQSLKVEKNQVGSEAEVGMSTKGEKDRSGRDLLRDTFPGSNARLRILLGCLVCFFSAFCEEVRNRPCLHSIL